jgi:DNA primase
MVKNIEDIKQIDLVEFLSTHYGMRFSPHGNSYVSLSAFTEEKKPSFFVRQVGDRWLFKDFSSGQGGSIIDFVLLHEGLSDVSDALMHIDKLLSGEGNKVNQMDQPRRVDRQDDACGYDIQEIYRKIRANDHGVCKEYLAGRGICSEAIDDLTKGGLLLHNRYQGYSWCCFAVFDQRGELRCLDNHKIGGDDKFVLGQKDIFTYDWKILPEAGRVFICEGIIDYLSLKTLQGRSIAGIALLGNNAGFDTSLLKSTREIISALDSDEGGLRGLLDLQDTFSDRQISMFDLGSCKDPNEYLMKTQESKEATNLNAEDKLALYKKFMGAENKSEVAQRLGINRSYMYQVVKECEENILSGFSQRHPGRKPNHAPATLDEAMEKIAALEEEKKQAEIEKEKYYARSEFMKLRLKWAEIEASGLREHSSEDLEQSGKKKQIKKKRSRRL